jgi:hypothetical protein
MKTYILWDMTEPFLIPSCLSGAKLDFAHVAELQNISIHNTIFESLSLNTALPPLEMFGYSNRSGMPTRQLQRSQNAESHINILCKKRPKPI